MEEWIDEAFDILYEDEEIPTELVQELEPLLQTFFEKIAKRLSQEQFFEIINLVREALLKGEVGKLRKILEGKMGVVTVTFEFGSKGLELAKEIARVLGYDLFYKEILVQTVKRLGLDTKEIENFDEFNYMAAKLTFFDFLKLESDKLLDFSIFSRRSEDEEAVTFADFKEMLTKTITNLAFSNNVVLVGHAAVGILRDYPNTVHIKVEAPFEDRVKLVSQKLGISEEEAEDKIKEIDEREKKFYLTIAGVDIKPIDLFHLKLNSSKVSPQTGARVVAELARKVIKD